MKQLICFLGVIVLCATLCPGPVGLRLDMGDEMYFNSGTHHNLRVAFGPFLTF